MSREISDIQTLVSPNHKIQVHEFVKETKLGQLYRGQIRTSREEAAILVMTIDDRQEIQTRLEHLELASVITHPHIQAIFSYGARENQLYVVNVWTDGIDHEQWRTDNRGDYKKIASVFEKIALAAQYAANLKIFHGNIGLDNVALSAEPVILSYGLFANHSPDTKSKSHPVYSPPKLLQGDRSNSTAGADAYGIGQLLYWALTGQALVDNQKKNIFHRILTGGVVPVNRWDANVPQSLVEICNKSIAKKPNRRYQSPDELANDLRRFIDDQPVDTSSPSSSLDKRN